jgi:hypothetical protein
MDALKEKLAQFPSGTKFLLSRPPVESPVDDQTLTELRTFLTSHGMSLAEQSVPSRLLCSRQRMQSSCGNWLNAIRVAQAVFERAINLREALYWIFKSVADGQKPKTPDIEKLNYELVRARACFFRGDS